MASGTLQKQYNKTEIDTLIGKFNTDYTSKSPSAVNSSGDLVNCTSASVSAGTYLVIAGASFSANSSGYRQIGVAESASSEKLAQVALAREVASSNNETVLSLSFIYQTSSTKTLYLNVKASTSVANPDTLSVTGRMQIICLKKT